MSSASKLKFMANDKPSSKALKEQQKGFNLSASVNGVNVIPTSAYNPISGMFHTLETTSTGFPPSPHTNGRFHTIDDTDSSHGTSNEYDSASNNGSSGDLDDLKDKLASTTLRQETIPGADNEKREKIRQKNEKKHARQRERRAQELHDRCCGYLMSRKLELLSKQLVSMGFSSERATSSLILNKGNVEESVSWLLEGGENEDRVKDTPLKINITEELARIETMEVKYKSSKQEVERAVVASEGDLDKAEDTLKIQKQETSKLEESVKNQKFLNSQEKSTVSWITENRINERDFNYVKVTPKVLGYPEAVNKISLLVKSTNQPKQLLEKRSWPAIVPSLPVQVAPPSSAKMEATTRHSMLGHDVRNLQQAMAREPVIMMQLPQSLNAKNILTSGTLPPQYSNNNPGFEILRANEYMLRNQNMGNFGMENPNLLNLRQLYQNQNGDFQHYHPQSMIRPADSIKVHPAGLSLGLFSGRNSPGKLNSSSHLDWNTGGSMMPHCDYSNIDWSVDPGQLQSLKPTQIWSGPMNGVHVPGSQGRVVPESSAGAREWTSPFAGNDLFSVPRQFVTFPSP